MIVHTLKMCTGDAGPEQSLVLFYLVKEMRKVQIKHIFKNKYQSFVLGKMIQIQNFFYRFTPSYQASLGNSVGMYNLILHVYMHSI